MSFLQIRSRVMRLFLAAGIVAVGFSRTGFAWASPDAHHGAEHHGVTFWNWPQHMGDPVGVGYLLINFVVLLLILNKLIFKPLRARNAARSESIRSELERATEARSEAERLLGEAKERVSRIETESKQILDGARQRAEATRAELIAKAEADAIAIRKNAQEFAEREASRMRAEIEAEVVARAVDAAEAKIRQLFTADDQARLVDAYVGEVTQLNLAKDLIGSSAPRQAN